MNTQKSLLLILRNPSFAGSNNRDTLDIALGCSVFDIPVSLLFLNDAVFQLLNNQESQVIEQKDLSPTLKALDMYDIQDHYILEKDLQRYQLEDEALLLNCKTLTDSQLALFIRQFDIVINL
ncbi:MAG: sulfurtransferase complex subunit TusC [Oceanospirillaceae bacterium]